MQASKLITPAFPLTRRTSPLLGAGFSALVLLILISAVILGRRAQTIEQQVMATQRGYTQVDRVLQELRFQTMSLALEYREYLLAEHLPELTATTEKIQRRGQLLLK